MAEKAQKTLESTLEEVKAKTGKTVEEFRQMAAEKGITKTSQLVQWLSSEYGLGYHQAGAINVMLFHTEKAQVSDDELIATHFSGNKAIWREGYDRLIPQVKAFGEDVEVAPNMTYINLNRKGKKFAFLQTTASRLDIGIKRKGVAAEGRFEAAGSWNAMVTHRLRISDPQEIDDEVVEWLRQAYAAAK